MHRNQITTISLHCCPLLLMSLSQNVILTSVDSQISELSWEPMTPNMSKHHWLLTLFFFLMFFFFFGQCSRTHLLSVTNSESDISIRMFSGEHSNHTFVTSHLKGSNSPEFYPGCNNRQPCLSSSSIHYACVGMSSAELSDERNTNMEPSVHALHTLYSLCLICLRIPLISTHLCMCGVLQQPLAIIHERCTR